MRNRIYLIAALVTSFNIGMAARTIIDGDDTSTAHIVSRLSGISQNILTRATEDIEAASKEDFMSDEESHFIIEITYGDMIKNDKGTVLAYAQGNGHTYCKVVLSRDIDPESSSKSVEDFRTILIHEIGHCFGLEHNEDEMSVMFWAYSPLQNSKQAFDNFIVDLNKARSIL